MSMRYSALLALACLFAWSGVAEAKGRLLTVVPTDGGCVQLPADPPDQFYNVEPGKTYLCTIDQITDCANGGTDNTIGIRVNATGPGFIDLVAAKVSTGVYQFTITMPVNNPSCTLPIHYCTPPGSSDPGLSVLRDQDEKYPAHFRMASFGPGCSNPTFPFCSLTPARSRTWAQVKQIYR